MARAGDGEGGAAVFPDVTGVQSGRAFRASAIRRAFGPRGVYEFRPRLDVEHEWFLVSATSHGSEFDERGLRQPGSTEFFRRLLFQRRRDGRLDASAWPADE